MSDQIRIKVERSSLGTKKAREQRQSVSAIRAANAVARAAQFRQKRATKDGG
ncbi:hypothetical protein [Kribbella sp. CA-247076]|uniref:hypothetical protein n=1 Tax=Kribbella sp. CA-247076 TaxID=3239941 RepID=UPI003D8D84F7